MGFIVSLKFAAKCFDLFAWPLITVVYPLYSSIRAIESNSNGDNRKWLTYWVLYSLIFLFELASAKLIQWLPFWPYLKLIVTLYLVAPQFDGAVYVYEQFVRPCISLNPQDLNNWFIQQQDFLRGSSDDFLVAAERFIKENGSDELEKLIVSKAQQQPQVIITWPIVPLLPCSNGQPQQSLSILDPPPAPGTIDPIVPAALLDQHARCSPSQQVCSDQASSGTSSLGPTRPSGPNFSNSPGSTSLPHSSSQKSLAFKKISCANENNAPMTSTKNIEATAAAEKVKQVEPNLGQTENKTGIAEEKKTQKEWFCTLCKVRSQSEVCFNDHLRGKRHKEELMAQKEWFCTLCQVRSQSEVSFNDHLRGKRHKEELMAQKEWFCTLCKVRSQSQVCLNDHLRGKKHQEELGAQKMAAKNKSGSVSVPKKAHQLTMTLWCDKCNIWCNNKTLMDSHLTGKKHKAKLQEVA